MLHARVSSARSTATRGWTCCSTRCRRSCGVEPRRARAAGRAAGSRRSGSGRRRGCLGIADKVIFAGRVPHADVARYYSVIDLLVYPRKSIRLTETVTPLKPLEAMAQGRLLDRLRRWRPSRTDSGRADGFSVQGGDSAAALAGAVQRRVEDAGAVADHEQAGRQYVEGDRNWHASVSL